MNFLRDFQFVGKDLFDSGLNNSHSGNLSMRNNRMMAISRSGAMLHRLEFSDIVETLIDREDLESARASREIPVHRAIYQGTDAEAVVHAHPPHIIALSLQSDRIFPIDAEGAYFFQNGIPVVGVKNAIASDEVAQKVVPLLKESPIVVVRGHGTFAIGKNLEEGFHWTSSIEHSSKILLLRNQFAVNPNFT
jgi:L-fuculose-phosphate aldolase